MGEGEDLHRRDLRAVFKEAGGRRVVGEAEAIENERAVIRDVIKVAAIREVFFTSGSGFL